MRSVFNVLYIGILFLFPFGFSGHISAQIPEFSATHYTSENIGLSHNTVLSMTTDSYGFVWISTMDGLSRFDGKSVKIYRHIPNDINTLSDSFIHGLFEHKSGNFLIGTRDGGLNILNPKTDRITRINSSTYPSSNFPKAPINVIFEDTKGFLWLGFFTNSIGHFDYEAKKFFPTQLVEKGTGRQIYSTNSILELNDGAFLLSSLNGLFYISSKEVEKFRSSPDSGNEVFADRIFFSAEYPSPNTDSIFLDSEGGVWINLVGEGFRKINPSMFSESIYESIATGTARSSVQKLYLERGDYIIKGHTAGDIELINKKTQQEQIIPVVNVEGAVGASTLFEDEFGNLWFYTWGGGFFRLKEKKGIKLFTNKSGAEKLPSTFVLAFEEEETGMWIGTNEGLAFLNNNDGFNVISKKINDRIGSIWSLEKDNQGLWVATRTKGLFLIPEKSIKNWNPELISFDKENSLLPNDNVHQVVKDSRGWLWLGFQGEGIRVIKNPKQWISGQPANTLTLKNDGEVASINSNSIRKIYEDKAGNMWVATTDNGFNYLTFSGERLVDVQFFENDSNSTLQIPHRDGRSVYQQNDSTFWFATYGGGIIRWTRGTNQLLTLQTPEGLPNNSVYGILGDENPNYIWMSTNNGLGRLETKDFSFTTFTKEDGLQNNEFNTGAFFKSSNGNLYFGGVNGFNIINTKELSVNEHPPKVFLTGIHLFNEEFKRDSAAVFIRNLKLNYDENFLSFEFIGLDYEEPLSNSYAYKMEGIDPGWVYSGNRNFADYPNLKPGNYTFRVKAATKYGAWNEEGASLSVQILPPWWQTWWFRTVYISLLLGAFIGLVRYYSQRKLKEEIRQMEIKNKLRNERERISRDLHDHVGAQLANIISGLSLIDKYAEVDNKEKSASMMKSLKGDAEVTIKQLRETIWALNQNELTLEGFTNHLNTYFKNQSALTEQLSLKIDSEQDKVTKLSATQALNLFRIIQEASQNTLKYANAKNLEINLRRQNGSLEVFIKDDGTFKGDQQSFNGGYGLNNIQKRAKEIFGDVEFKTEEGTEIRVKIPI